jgi:CBS domain-containing protein
MPDTPRVATLSAMTSDRLRLDHIRVRDAMHEGILSCSVDASLVEVATIMATHRVHAVAIVERDRTQPLGVISDLDVVAAVASGAGPTPARAAATEPLALSSDERLDRATQMMAEHGASHVLVNDAATGHPIGVLSTLDVAAVYADGRARRGSPPHETTFAEG